MRLIRPWLFVGNYRDTMNRGLLDAQGIQSVLQMAEDVRHPGIDSLYLPIQDGVPLPMDLFEQGMAFIRQARQSEHTLMIACGAGISRSVTFATAALKEEEGLTLTEAYSSLKALHPEAMPHPQLWSSLCRHYNETVPYRTILAIGRSV